MTQSMLIYTITYDVLVLARLPDGQIVWHRRRVSNTTHVTK